MENQEVIAKLKEEGREVYARLEAAFEKKDWLNFALLSDQMENIISDMKKFEAEKDQGIER